MKSFILLAALFISNNAFARQYIQCGIIGDTSDVAVVNLTTENGGTLFLSSGMENSEDERVLVKIKLDKIENGKHFYKVIDEKGEGLAIVPNEVIGKSSKYFETTLSFAGLTYDYACFSAIYSE
jgi:hypothetical protein